MKKKYITERKWNKIYDHLQDDLCEKSNEDGSVEFTPENYDKWIYRVENMPDYQIIGVKYQIGRLIDRLKEKRRGHALTNLKVGKLVLNKNDTEKSLCVEGISTDVHWQTDRILAIIIRDYLRSFIRETPVIGNCVLEDGEKCLGNYVAYDSENSEYKKRWEDTVNKVADEFDEIRHLIENRYSDTASTDEETQKAINKTFNDLAFIYNDLNW